MDGKLFAISKKVRRVHLLARLTGLSVGDSVLYQ